MNYYVYHGYVNCDNYDNYPTHKLSGFATKEEVVAFYKEFREDNLRDDNAEVFFRVIEGKELSLNPIKVVTDFELS